MRRKIAQFRFDVPRWTLVAVSAVLICLTAGIGSGSSGALASGSSPAISSPDAVCPGGICFTDVTASNPFFTTINALYQDDIISGYACGGVGEPCDASNRPYYRSGNSVTRGQMSKFVDNGRKNISDAIGHSLTMITNVFEPLVVETSSNGNAIKVRCTTASNGCTAIQAYGATGDYAGNFLGGRGVLIGSGDPNYPAVDGHSYDTGAYGGRFISDSYVALRAEAPSSNNGFIQLSVVGTSNTLVSERIFNGALYVEGNLTVGGSKSGYVVDSMQNVDSTFLEPGDVVAIAGSSAPLIGEIPVVTVKKASEAYSTGVVGVVDQVLYVPDAATKAAYDAQLVALRKAQLERDEADKVARAQGVSPDYSNIAMPDLKVNDEQGTVHAIEGATRVLTNGYANVVTLGSYKGVKVDASFGPIHAGDLLVASSHAGYAMKASDRSLTSGATIGKALADLETGTGLIPVMVTLK